MRVLSPVGASVVGVVLDVVLFAGALALAPLMGSAPSFGSPLFYWHNAPTALVNAVLAIFPGFAAGFLASRQPLVVGCVVGAVGCALQVAVISLAWEPLPMAQLFPTLLVGGLIGAISQGVSALAGAHVRQGAP
jgi:hypothetical protein